MITTDRKPSIRSIQLCRAVAALAVVYTHCAGEGQGGFHLRNTGAWGVDIFFVISGFIIAYIVTRDTRRFMIKRICRLVPLYVIATLTVIAVTLLFPSLVQSTTVSVPRAVQSLLFIPYPEPLKNDQPILGQGWTLRFELLFYLMMAVCIPFVRNKARLGLACGALLLVFLIALGVTDPPVFILQYYRRQAVLPEFVYGILLYYAYAYARFHEQKVVARLPWLFAALALASLACLLAHDLAGLTFATPRYVQVGIPALVFVAALLGLESRLARDTPLIRFGLLLGDASYGMYLFHYHIIALLSRVVFRHLGLGDGSFGVELVKVLAAFAAVIAGGVCVYILLDRPIQARLRPLYTPRPVPVDHPSARSHHAPPSRAPTRSLPP